jgi:hypothetical protein
MYRSTGVLDADATVQQTILAVFATQEEASSILYELRERRLPARQSPLACSAQSTPRRLAARPSARRPADRSASWVATVVLPGGAGATTMRSASGGLSPAAG